jgi:PAS domain S-box-containing protein
MKTATDKGTQTLLNKRLLKVLLVDDEATDRIPVERILRTCSSPAEFVVESVVNLSEAIKNLTEKQYDVVLLDLELPDCSGIEILHQVVKVAPDIPVVVLTELDDEQTGFSALEDGATDYLVKDLPLDVVLVRTIVYAIQRKKIQMQSLKLAHDNNERMKELNCLYGISNLVETPGISLEEMLEKTVRLLPAGWQYPDIACARIIFEGKEYKTDNFKPSKWTQSADITLQGQKVGTVEVSYMEERPQSDEGPFPEEKRDLIDAIGERLGKMAERFKAEETQKRLVTLIEATPDFVGFADAKGKHIIYVNKAGRKMCGIGNDEDVTKLNISDLHPEWANKMLAEEILPAAVRDGVWIGECAFLNIRDRHEIPVLMALSSQKASDGEVEVVSTISHDITYRKKAEEALNDSHKRLINVLDSLDSLVYVAEFNSYDILFINKYGRDMWGAVQGRKCWQAIQKDQKGPCSFCTNDKLVSAAGIPAGVCKWEFQNTVNGRWYECRDQAIPWTGKSLVRLEIATDITERKKAEENLAILNQKNELILRAAAEGILGLDLHGNHIFVNPAAAKMLGYEAEELIGRPSHSTWHHTKPDGSPYPKEECQIYTSFLDGAVHRSSIEVFWRKDGTSFPVEYASTPIYEQSRLVGTVVTFADITERKKAEEMLREKSTLLEKVINSLPDFIFAKDSKLRTIICNEAYASAVGKKPDEMIGHTDIENGWDSELVCGNPAKGIRGFENDDRDALSGKTIHNPYDQANTPNGVLIFDTYKMPLHGKDSEIIGMLGIARDITERKKAEKMLRESEERYKNLFMANIDGMLVADTATKKFRYANPAICRMLGYSEEEFTQMGVADIHPKESLEQVIAEFEAMASGAKVTAKNLPCVRKDGQIISVNISTVPVMIDQAKYLLGIFHDITKRKSREKQDFS